MTKTLRNIRIVLGVSLACVALLSACSRSSGTASTGSVEVRLYPTATAAAIAPAATSVPNQPAIAKATPPSQPQAATATAAASTGDPAGDKVEQMLQKLDDSLNKTDTLQDVP